MQFTFPPLLLFLKGDSELPILADSWSHLLTLWFTLSLSWPFDPLGASMYQHCTHKHACALDSNSRGPGVHYIGIKNSIMIPLHALAWMWQSHLYIFFKWSRNILVSRSQDGKLKCSVYINSHLLQHCLGVHNKGGECSAKVRGLRLQTQEPMVF